MCPVVGCHKSKEEKQEEVEKAEYQAYMKIPAAASTAESGGYLVKLFKSGKLPGAEKLSGLTAPNAKIQTTNYPMSRAWTQKIQNDNFVNNYIVTKSSADDPWQLERAWRTDSNGVVVEEFPLPKE